MPVVTRARGAYARGMLNLPEGPFVTPAFDPTTVRRLCDTRRDVDVDALEGQEAVYVSVDPSGVMLSMIQPRDGRYVVCVPAGQGRFSP